MTTSSRHSSASILNGKIESGIYKIQNIVSQTYLEIWEHSKKLCCRPAAALEDGKGLWEILPCGIGYTIRRLDPGNPDQFCTMLCGLEVGTAVSVAPFSAAWRLEIADEERYRGFNYIRFFWGTTEMHWDLSNWGSTEDRTPVLLHTTFAEPCSRLWKLIPIQLDRFHPTPTPITRIQEHPSTETEEDEFGTTVVEVSTTTTTTTNTITKRKNLRN